MTRFFLSIFPALFRLGDLSKAIWQWISEAERAKRWASEMNVVFSSDTVADDWHPRISPKRIITLALKRLEAHGKGILLLHDIHRATVAALPDLLKELKEQAFHVVQVVPAPVRQF